MAHPVESTNGFQLFTVQYRSPLFYNLWARLGQNIIVTHDQSYEYWGKIMTNRSRLCVTPTKWLHSDENSVNKEQSSVQKRALLQK